MNIYLLRHLQYKLLDSIAVFQDKGMLAGLASLRKLIVELIYRHSDYIVIVKTLSDQGFHFRQNADLTIQRIKTREQVDELRRFVDRSDMARFHIMMDQGSDCFAGYQDNKAIGCAWASRTNDIRVNRVQPHLFPGDVCVHDLFVAPEYRGLGIGRTLASYRLHYLRDQGYKRAVGIILENNIPALIINEKMGYIQIGKMSHARFLFWDRFRYTY